MLGERTDTREEKGELMVERRLKMMVEMMMMEMMTTTWHERYVRNFGE